MNDTTLQYIQQKIGYQFKNPALLKQAFVAPSLTHASQNRIQNYQILELIGDAVLGLTVTKRLAEDFCHIDSGGQFVSLASVGHIAEEKTSFIKNERLAQCTKAHGFDSFLERAHGNRSHDYKNKKGDLFESILGAVAIDSNWNVDIFSNVAKKMFDCDVNSQNACERLQALCEKRFGELPIFSFWNNGSIRCDCVVAVPFESEVFVGNGKSMREAQNSAAEVALNFVTSSIKFDADGNKGTATKENPQKNTLNPIEALNLKFLKNEIAQPLYCFTQVKENGKNYWLCVLSLNDKGRRVSAKAASRKKAKQATAKIMLSMLDDKPRGLLKRAMGMLEKSSKS